MSISITLANHVPAAPVHSEPSAGPAAWPVASGAPPLDRFVAAADFLLAAVVAGLGPGDHDAVLLDGLAAVLALDGRESALPALGLIAGDDLRGVLARQAQAIGAAILDAARQAAKRRRADQGGLLAGFEIRSPCEGHVWTPDVAALLMGPSGGPGVMQLYNEWQHQLLLLRDALLPFADWRTLPLPVARVEGGLRATEATREKLLGALLIGRPEHALLIAQAGALFGHTTPADGYGFQLAEGVVLPAFLQEPEDRFLLRHHPIVIDGTDGPATFVYADPDYYAAPRRTIVGGADHAPSPAAASRATLRADPTGTERAFLSLDLEVDGRHHAIDLGRIFRGVRFAAGPQQAAIDHRADQHVRWRPAGDLFGPELITADSGIYAIPSDPTTALALAGTIYPENIVIARGEPVSALRFRGKGFGPLFIIGDIGR